MIQIYIKTKIGIRIFINPIQLYTQYFFNEGLNTLIIETVNSKTEYSFKDIEEFDYDYENRDVYDFLEEIKNEIMKGK